MKFYLLNRKNKKDMLTIGLLSFDKFIWEQGLLQLFYNLLLHSLLLLKYKIVDQNSKLYTIELFITIVEKLKNKD